MTEMKAEKGGVCTPAGFRAAGIHCGVRANKEKKDLALIVSDCSCAAAAVYTTNKVCGAPITVTRAHLLDGHAQAIVCNSGNANTCNADGVEKADRMAELAAAALDLSPADIVVASTGVIGQTLDLAPIEAGIPAASAALSAAGSDDAAHAIMTTDQHLKSCAVHFTVGGKQAALGGISKGSGMIHPNMATMLSFLVTDAAVSPEMLQKALAEIVSGTYNMITVDGDTSTNDMVCLLANGRAGNAEIASEGADLETFKDALRCAAVYMSRAIAKDGEGATKLLECRVCGAADLETARKAARAVVGSSLVKAAMFGADANWGRVLCALGYSGADAHAETADVAFSSAAGRVCVCRQGSGIPFSEEMAKQVLLEDEVVLEVGLHDGGAAASAWGCDLTYDYVKINGDYRT